MTRYKPQERYSRLQPVVLSEQMAPGSIAFAQDDLVDHELDLTAMHARLKSDEVGASACDPACDAQSRVAGLQPWSISSRAIERACQRNVKKGYPAQAFHGHHTGVKHSRTAAGPTMKILISPSVQRDFRCAQTGVFGQPR